jgi:hypothetical protein
VEISPTCKIRGYIGGRSYRTDPCGRDCPIRARNAEEIGKMGNVGPEKGNFYGTRRRKKQHKRAI